LYLDSKILEFLLARVNIAPHVGVRDEILRAAQLHVVSISVSVQMGSRRISPLRNAPVLVQ
jgi:hypothetical protein